MKDIIYFQTKHFSEVKTTKDGVEIEWFASTKDIDRYRDIVRPKAFEEAIKMFKKNPIMLLQHNHEKPIWTFTEFVITSKWLKVRWVITNDIDNVIANVQSWLLKGFSIWFIAKSWELKEKNWIEIREITELELLEISVVSVPANPFTLFQAVKKYFNSIKKEDMYNKKANKEEILDEVQDKSNDISNAPIVDFTDNWSITEEKLDKWFEEAEEVIEEVKTDEAEKAIKEAKELLTKAGFIIKEATEEETHELHNETPEDSANSDETSEEGKEAEEETSEEAEWNSEAETEGETEADNSWETESEDIKNLINNLVDIVQKQATELNEMKSVISGISVKKGLKTIWNTVNTDRQADNAWVKAFKNAKQWF